MQKKQYADVNAQCPYYYQLDERSIQCSGNEIIKFSYRGIPKNVKAQFKMFCCCAWRECPLADGLNRYFERSEK